MRRVSFFVAALISATGAHPSEIVDSGNILESLKGQVFGHNDTISGYALPAFGRPMRLVSSKITPVPGSAAGNMRFIQTVFLNTDSKIKLITVFNVTDGSGENGRGVRWSGNSCTEPKKFIRINRIRGGLDRCGTAEIVERRISDKSETTLSVRFLESNEGRYYSLNLDFILGAVNLLADDFKNAQSPSNLKLQKFIEDTLDNVVAAGSFNKVNPWNKPAEFVEWILDEKQR